MALPCLGRTVELTLVEGEGVSRSVGVSMGELVWLLICPGVWLGLRGAVLYPLTHCP